MRDYRKKPKILFPMTSSSFIAAILTSLVISQQDGWHSNISYTTATRKERDEPATAGMDLDEEEEGIFQWILSERLPSTTEDQPADETEE